MAEQAGAQGAGAGAPAQNDQNQGQGQGQGQQGLSNAEIKNHPLFLKLAEQLAGYQKAEQDRATAEADAKRQKEIEDARKASDFEKALKLEQEQAAAKVRAAEQRALQAELRSTLIGKGVTPSEGFFKVALAEYDPAKHADLNTFAESLKANEQYAPFFKPADPGRKPVQEPAGTPVNSGAAVWDSAMIAKVKNWEQNGTPKEQLEAAKLLGEYRKTHGKYPY